MTFTHALSTNNYGTAKFIVDANAANGTHTTIASAITSASSGDTIFIRPGTYTENLTLKAGVNLSAYQTDSANGTVTIVGKLTATYTGTVNLAGIRLQTNSDYAIESTGSNAAILNLNMCYLNCTNNTGINGTNSNASIGFTDSQGAITTTGITYFTGTGTNFSLTRCSFGNAGASTTATTASAGVLTFLYSSFTVPISLTTTGGLNAYWTNFSTASQNVTTLTVDSSATKFAHHCIFSSGTATPVVITSGLLQLTYCLLTTTNATAAISGAGSINWHSLTFGNTGSNITVTTQIPFIQTNNLVKVKTPGAYPYTAVPQDYIILVDTSAARTINLNSSPATGQRYVIKDSVGSAGANAITISPASGNIDGATSFSININYGSATLIYNGSEWSVV